MTTRWHWSDIAIGLNLAVQAKFGDRLLYFSIKRSEQVCQSCIILKKSTQSSKLYRFEAEPGHISSRS